MGAILRVPVLPAARAAPAVIYVTHRFDAVGGRPAHVGVWTGVLNRFPDGWKIIHSHGSDRSAPH
jgi:hypothetical protein